MTVVAAADIEHVEVERGTGGHPRPLGVVGHREKARRGLLRLEQAALHRERRRRCQRRGRTAGGTYILFDLNLL